MYNSGMVDNGVDWKEMGKYLVVLYGDEGLEGCDLQDIANIANIIKMTLKLSFSVAGFKDQNPANWGKNSALIALNFYCLPFLSDLLFYCYFV